MRRAPTLTCLLLALGAGCAADHGDRPAARDPRAVAAPYLVDDVPPEVVRVDAQFGDAVAYVGYAIDPAPIVPGDEVTITHYWRVLAAPGDVRVFAALRGGPAREFVPLDDSPMRRALPPARWQPGQLLEDPQTFVVPPGWIAGTAQVELGLIAVGRREVGDRVPVVIGHSHDRVAQVATLPIDLANAPPPPPPPGTVLVKRARGPIKIDGIANEATWTGATSSPPFVKAEGDGSPNPAGSALAKLTWDDAGLYVWASITDPDVWSQYHEDDSTLWKEDVLELFIDADGNRRGYVELQVNPNNAHFDSWFQTTRAQPGDVAWSSGMTSAVRVRGTANQRGDKDTGWDVEIAIPWAAVKGRDDAMAVTLPPALGQQFRMNVVRGDQPEKGRLSASSWNAITYQDFHALDRMLTVVFVDEDGRITPRAKPAAVDVAPDPDDGDEGDVAPAAGSGTAPPVERLPGAPLAP